MSVPTKLKTSPWSRSALKSIGTIKSQKEVNVTELCYIIWVEIQGVMAAIVIVPRY